MKKIFFILLLFFPAILYAQEEKIALGVGDGITLHGTLLLPEGVERPPVALIVAGTGEMDRDGSPLNLYRHLAEDLQKEGIATLRFDKRGVGESEFMAGKHLYEKTVLEDFTDDVRRLVSMLYNDGRFSQVVIVGHSEGALHAKMAARDNPEVAGIVSLLGAGRRYSQVVREQIERFGLIPDEFLPEFYGIVESLARGEYVEIAADSPWMISYPPGRQAFWMSVFRPDPVAELVRLAIPVMIVHGGVDVIIVDADFEALAAAYPSAELFVIDDMDHMLRQTTATTIADQVVLYAIPLPNHPALAPAIARFINPPQ